MRHCPGCGSEFQDWVETCLDCGTPLKDGSPDSIVEDLDESETNALEGLNDGEKSRAGLEEFVDEMIEDQDFVNPEALDDYGEKIEVSPRANLVSVMQSRSAEMLKKSAVVLRAAGIKIYLLKKAGVFDDFYVMMVKNDDSEKAEQILKDTEYGTLIPIDPTVEDPELKDAPVINLDEEKPLNNSASLTQESEVLPICPICCSDNIEVKSSFFSTKPKLKCRDCGHQWKAQ